VSASPRDLAAATDVQRHETVEAREEHARVDLGLTSAEARHEAPERAPELLGLAQSPLLAELVAVERVGRHDVVEVRPREGEIEIRERQGLSLAALVHDRLEALQERHPSEPVDANEQPVDRVEVVVDDHRALAQEGGELPCAEIVAREPPIGERLVHPDDRGIGLEHLRRAYHRGRGEARAR
jgi:hypothetical protein